MDVKISNFQQIASIRKYTLTEGREKGLDVLDCDNGKIRFLLNVSKACDIMQLYHEGHTTTLCLETVVYFIKLFLKTEFYSKIAYYSVVTFFYFFKLL